MSNQQQQIHTDVDESGYASDREEEHVHPAMSESFKFYLSGMFDSDACSDDDDDDTILSKEEMPPPPRDFTTTRTSNLTSSLTSSSDDGTSTPSGQGYASGDSYSSFSPLTSSSGTETPPSSDEEMWEIHYLNKKRKLLMRACNVLKREDNYNASIATTLATRETFDSPLWVEAKKIASFETRNATRAQQPPNNTSVLGKRPRIDVSSVYLLKGDIHQELSLPQLFTVETTSMPVSEDDDDENTMDLSHAIAFSPIAQ